jgi:type I restriction enzyme S subunit
MSNATIHIETEKQLVPALRFKEFLGNWSREKIQKLIDQKYIVGHLDGNHGELYPKSEEFVEKGIPYVSANDFIDGVTNLDGCKFLTEERAATFKKGIAKNGDVLFAHNATVGPTAVLTTNYPYVILSTTATYYRCNPEKLINYFLKNYFQTDSFIRQYFRVKSQSTRDQVPITQQRKFDTFLPSLPEQQKIASFLPAVDEKIQQLTKKMALLEQYKKGVMQQLFSGQLRFKDENGNLYPDWKEKRLGDLANINMGQSPDSKSYNEDSIGVLLIQGNADINGRITAPRQYTSEPTKTCEIGDLILTVRAPVGSVSKSVHKACIGRGVCSIVNKTNSIQDFLFQFLLSYEDKWGRLEQGSTFTAVSGKDIKTLKLKTPCIEEQQKIATYLSSIDTKIEAINNQITQTQTFKKGLLQQMFV